MKVAVVFMGLTLLICKGYSQNAFLEISKKTCSAQMKIKPKEPELVTNFHKIRSKDEIATMIAGKDLDTVYMLESFDITNGSYYGRIWNNQIIINYTYHNGAFDFEDVSTFTKYTCSLIEKWDTKSIRKEEKANSSLTSPLMIFGSIVTSKGNKIKAKCIRFKEFYLLERDRE